MERGWYLAVRQSMERLGLRVRRLARTDRRGAGAARGSTIGDPDVAIRVKNAAHWQVNHLYATSYRKGRVFIAGDAAHRHPPSGGLGTNTSVQDAFNLVWKLRFELAGKAGPELLDSYYDERQPVGQSVVERAMKSLYNVAPVPRALGFSKGQSAEEGWASLNDLFSGRPGAEERRDALAAAVKLQDYRSNALGVELGQRYQRGALVYDGTLTLSLLDWVSSQLVSRLRYQFSAPSKPVLFEGRNVSR